MIYKLKKDPSYKARRIPHDRAASQGERQKQMMRLIFILTRVNKPRWPLFSKCNAWGGCSSGGRASHLVIGGSLV